MFQQNLRQLIQSILEEYHFEESFREKWRQEESLVSLISSAASSTELKDRALEYMQGFQEAALQCRSTESADGGSELYQTSIWTES